eukprot:16714-Chlamydomonas_euryale.AAC.7
MAVGAPAAPVHISTNCRLSPQCSPVPGIAHSTAAFSASMPASALRAPGASAAVCSTHRPAPRMLSSICQSALMGAAGSLRLRSPSSARSTERSAGQPPAAGLVSRIMPLHPCCSRLRRSWLPGSGARLQGPQAHGRRDGVGGGSMGGVGVGGGAVSAAVPSISISFGFGFGFGFDFGFGFGFGFGGGGGGGGGGCGCGGGVGCGCGCGCGGESGAAMVAAAVVAAVSVAALVAVATSCGGCGSGCGGGRPSQLNEKQAKTDACHSCG